MEQTLTLTAADREYVRARFIPLADACAAAGLSLASTEAAVAAGQLPAATYVLDGVPYVPRTYFALLQSAGDLAAIPDHFAARHAAAGGHPDDLGPTWNGWIGGGFGACLIDPTPEAMVRKDALMTAITALLDAPRPDDTAWTAQLRAAVDALDALLLPFSPDHDRSGRFGRAPSRDRLVAAPRAAFPIG